MKKSRVIFQSKMTLSVEAINFIAVVFVFMWLSLTQTVQATVIDVVNQDFNNTNVGAISSANGWTYSSTWSGQTIGNQTNTHLSTNETSTPWNGLANASTIVDGDTYGNSSKYLSMNTGANYTFRPLFSLSTNMDSVFEMRFRTPNEDNVAEGATNKFILDDGTNKLWYFSYYAESSNSEYGNCLLWNNTVASSSTVMGTYARQLTSNTWYYIRVLVGKSTVSLTASNKIAIYLGTSLSEMNCIYEGPAVSSGYINPSAPRLRLESVQNAGFNIDDFKIYNMALPEVSVSLTNTNKLGDVITGGYTYTGNDGGSESGTSWTLWRADNAAMTNKVEVDSGTNSTASQELFTHTLSMEDFSCYLQLEVFPKGDNIHGIKGASDTIGQVVVWNKLYDANATAPILIQPINNFNLTNIALDFQWWRLGAATEYEIQFAQDENFTNPQSIAFNSTQVGYIGSEDMQLHYIMPDASLLSTGQWYWRVRTATQGTWSDVESFTVNNSQPMNPIVNRASKDDPMFLFEGWVITDFEKYADVFPEDIRDNCALTGTYRLESRWNGQKSYMEWIQPAVNNNLNYYFMVGSSNSMTSLSIIEWAFQNNPNVLGIQAAEFFWDLQTESKVYAREYFKRAVKLCAKYGKQFIWADGDFSNFKWQWVLNNTGTVSYQEYDGDVLSELSDTIATYHDYFVLQHKANIFYSGYASEGAVQGAWLANKSGELGYMPEPWYWPDWFIKLGDFQDGTQTTVGSVNFRKMPGIFWNQMMLKGLMQGASVFSLTGQFNIPYASLMDDFDESVDTAVFFGIDENNDIIKTSTYNNKVIPFIRAVLNKNTIPSKQEVLDSTKIAIDQGSTLWQPKKNTYFNLPTGKYRVYIYKTANSSDDPNAKIDIIHDGGTTTTYLDYSTGTSDWVDLGEYDFTIGSVEYIQNTLNTASKYVRSDAVKFVKGTDEYILDFGNIGYKEMSGTWYNDSSTTGYNSTSTRRSNTTGASVKWTPNETYWQHSYGPYDVLYRNTYGFKDLNSFVTGHKYEFIPNTGRYFNIPLLPVNYGTLPSNVNIVDLDDIQTASSVTTAFNNSYPETYTGNAYVVQTGNTIAIMSSSENEDITQTYSGVPINVGIVESMSGNIGPHAYIMAKKNDDYNDLWLQTNSEYPDRTINISFVCTSKPIVTVTPSTSLSESTWDYVTKTYSITLLYDANEPVEITLQEDVNPAQVLINNGDTGYTEISGTWSESSLTGYNGTFTKISNSVDASVKWAPNNIQSGVYRVYIYKAVDSSNDTNAKIDIIHDFGTTTKYIDYAIGSSGWIELGAYVFTNGAGGYVKNTLNTASKNILADAVKFVKEADVNVLDNGQVGYTELSGTWNTSGSLYGYKGSSTKFSNTANASVKWAPTLLSAGKYKVYIYKVVYTSNDPNAKIDIVYNGGTDTKYLNYTTGNSGWIEIGEYNFANGSSGYIKNTLNTASKYIRSDAVMFARLSN